MTPGKGKIFLISDREKGTPLFVWSWAPGEPSLEVQIQRLRTSAPPRRLPKNLAYLEVVDFSTSEERQQNLWSVRKHYPDLINDEVQVWLGAFSRERALLQFLREQKVCRLSNKKLIKEFGMSLAQLKRYLKKFKNCGTITVQRPRPHVEYLQGKKVWINDRTIIFNEEPDVNHSVSEAKVSQQGVALEGSRAAEKDSQHHEDLLGHSRGNPGPGWDAGSNRETGSGLASDDNQRRGDGLQESGIC